MSQVNINGDTYDVFVVRGVDSTSLPVQTTVDALGNQADTAATSDTGTFSLLALIKRLLGKLPSGFQQGGGAITSTTTRVTLATDGPGVGALNSIAGLSIPAHDYISLGYTGSNLTSVVYKTGGAGGTTVATLTLGYTGSNLTSVTKS